jgi:preprotein translocase subunit SecA
MEPSVPSRTRVANRLGWSDYLHRLQGSSVHLGLRQYESDAAAIASLEAEVQGIADAAITVRARAIRDGIRGGQPAAQFRAMAFALAREAARRVLGERPFDEQMVAALALDSGHVVEMQTGEGKTLAAVMPAAFNAFLDRGVHVLTFNDYLARRDGEWMRPVYRMLGVSVGIIQQGMSPPERRAAYAADVTYVTAKEAGFDHLRDLLAMTTADLVHRPFHYALVDEADSLMIDEARVPLVIAGSVGDRVASRAPRLAAIVASLSPGTHFDTDEYGRDVELTDQGIEFVERELGGGALHVSDAGDSRDSVSLLSELNCALHARVLLRRDVDYIVRDGRIEIIDEFTGRVVPDRHWPDGLQAALEAKEGLERRADGRILGSMTLQRFLSGYPRLAGMTGTARDAAGELQQFYEVEVIVIPTHRPNQRVDHDDVLFTHRDAKETAVAGEIVRAHATGRPVLVGTTTVTESERLAGRLGAAGVTCAVLNAKHDAEEASIVARAGMFGAVTIATNMAGRGTDIRLGGEDETDRERVASLGGLYVIGTNRHESRRVDLQLRGRAGRQGDPGESRFFISLEDELLVRYGIQRLIPAQLFPPRSNDPVESPVVRREVARAQRIVEGQNIEIRRTLARYATVVEDQHLLLTDRRQALLAGDETPSVWRRDEARRGALVAAAGEAAVVAAERTVTLGCIDRAWRDHLAFCADLREGIHLSRLAGKDPLTVFMVEVIQAYSGIGDAIDRAALEALAHVRALDGAVDISATGVKAPSSTWTYLVNDDPFRNRIGALLTGPGGATIAMFSAALLMPLFLVWGLVERLFRRSGGRRSNPFG